MTDMKQAALHYAKKGRNIFPARNKKPLVKWKEEATTNPDIIAGWWEQWPDAQIGLPCDGNNLLVFDIDPRNGGSYDALEELFPELPFTLTVHTQSGGLHLYFNNTSPIRQSPCSLGIDVKTAGYVIAPPTPGYAFDEVLPIEDLPLSVIDKLKPMTKEGPGKDIPDIGPIPHGMHHYFIVRQAGLYRTRNYELADAIRLVLDDCKRLDPPEPEADIIQRVQSIYELYQPEEAGTIEDIPELGQADVHFIDLLKEDLPEPPSLIDTFMPRGSITMIHATAGVGKTQLAMKLCKSAITGEPLFEWQPGQEKAQHVYYMDGELPRWLLKKRAASIFSKDDPITFFSAVTWQRDHGVSLDFQEKAHQNMLIDHIKMTGADMIVIDNRSNFYRGEENENDQAHAFNDFLKLVRELGVVVIVCHHSAKSGTYRGASAMVDVLDNVIALARDEPEVVSLKFEKHRLGQPSMYKVLYTHTYDSFDRLRLGKVT